MKKNKLKNGIVIDANLDYCITEKKLQEGYDIAIKSKKLQKIFQSLAKK